MQEDVTEFTRLYFCIDEMVNGDLHMVIKLFHILLKDVGYLTFCSFIARYVSVSVYEKVILIKFILQR